VSLSVEKGGQDPPTERRAWVVEPNSRNDWTQQETVGLLWPTGGQGFARRMTKPSRQTRDPLSNHYPRAALKALFSPLLCTAESPANPVIRSGGLKAISASSCKFRPGDTSAVQGNSSR